MTIDSTLIESLIEQAKKSTRLRINYDMRNTTDDHSQRMLNAMVPGTVIPIHRHRTSSETVIVLQGAITEIFFDERGVECARFDLDPRKGNYGVQIPVDQWHTVIVHEPTVILECKDGAYEPLSSDDIMPMD